MTFAHIASTQVLPALLENCRSGQRHGTSKPALLHWVTWTPLSSTTHSPLSLQLGLFKYLFCIYLAEKPKLGQDGDRAAPHTNLPSHPALTLKSGSILLRPRCAGPTQQNQPLQGTRWVRNPFLVHEREG